MKLNKTMASSNVIIGAQGANTASTVMTVNGTGSTNWATNNTAKITAQGQLNLEGPNADLVINGVKLSETLKAIHDRLGILQPNPELHSKYDNLRQAYEHYKTMEALLYESATEKK